MARRMKRTALWMSTGLVLGLGTAYAQPAEGEGEEKAQEQTEKKVVAPEVAQQVKEGKKRRGTDERPVDASSSVVASRYAKAVFESTTAVNIVDRAKLDRMQAQTAAEALREQEGIWVQQTGNIGGAPMIRGLMGNQVLLMVDGIRINHPGVPSGPNSYLTSVDIEDVERIEVLRGAGSALYGTDALGGVVNIVTKAPMDYTKGEWKAGGLLKTTFGSVDMQRRVRAEALAANDKIRARLGVTAQEVGDVRGGGEIGLQHPGGWDELNYDGRIDWRISSKQQLSFAAWHVGQDNMTRFDNYTRANATLGSRARNLYRLNYEHKKISKYFTNLNVTAYLHDQISDSENLEKPEKTSRSRYVSPGGDIQAQTPLGSDGRLLYGLHFHRDFGRSASKQAGVVMSRTPSSTWDNGAAFITGEYDVLPWLTLEAAGRLDYYRLVTSPNELAVPKGMTVDDLTLDTSNIALTGAFGLVARATPWMNVVAKVSNAFRAPNISDTVSAGPFTYGYTTPSPDVGPEKAIMTELGVRVDHKKVSASVTGFYTWINDLMARAKSTFNGKEFVDLNNNGEYDPDESAYQKKNLGGAWIGGAEASVEVRFTPQWVAFGNVSYVTGGTDPGEKDADGNALPNTPLDYAYPTNFTIGARWQQNRKQKHYIELVSRIALKMDPADITDDRLTGDAAFRSNPQDPKSPPLNGDGAPPAYMLLAVRAGAAINDYLDVRLSVGNVFNSEYRDKLSRIDGPGMSALGSLIGHF